MYALEIKKQAEDGDNLSQEIKWFLGIDWAEAPAGFRFDNEHRIVCHDPIALRGVFLAELGEDDRMTWVDDDHVIVTEPSGQVWRYELLSVPVGRS